MIEKRFWCLEEYERETSPIVDGKFAPTNRWLCNRLNELYEENEQLKQQIKELEKENASMKGRIINAMIQSNQVECTCTTCVCEDYVNEELKRW